MYNNSIAVEVAAVRDGSGGGRAHSDYIILLLYYLYCSKQLRLL